MTVRLCSALAVLMTVAFADAPASAQVQTDVPPVVPGARPAAVERVTIRGTSLEGNLEGNTAEREVLVFLPPGYARRRTATTRCAARLFDRSGTVYPGTHTSKIADRFQNHVMPCFSRTLCFRRELPLRGIEETRT